MGNKDLFIEFSSIIDDFQADESFWGDLVCSFNEIEMDSNIRKELESFVLPDQILEKQYEEPPSPLKRRRLSFDRPPLKSTVEQSFKKSQERYPDLISEKLIKEILDALPPQRLSHSQFHDLLMSL